MLSIELTIDDAVLQKAVANPQLVAGPVKDFLARVALTVEGAAKEFAPVDTGRLRASIATTLQPTMAIVRAGVFYAPHVEFGTRPHMPPVAALQPWARRHGGISAWALARSIALRGTRPQPFMRPAAEKAASQMDGFLQQLASDIEKEWEAGAHS